MPNTHNLPNDFEEIAKFLPKEGLTSQYERLESLLRIDISVLRKGGVLANHKPHNLMIMHHGKPIGVLELQASRDFLSIRNPNSNTANQSIPLTHTACNYGGQRKWFRCNTCDRRVGVLYFQGNFKCRHCTELNYESQYKSESSRLFAKAKKIRREIGGSENVLEPVPERPKGMHDSTYIKRVEAYLRCRNAALQSCRLL